MFDRVKVIHVALCFAEADFDLDKVTEKYVLDVLKRQHVISKGITAHVEKVETSEPPPGKAPGHLMLR